MKSHSILQFTSLPWHSLVPWNSSQNYSVLSRHLTPPVEPDACQQWVIHLKLATDRLKSDSGFVSLLKLSTYFNCCHFRTLAYTILDKLWAFFLYIMYIVYHKMKSVIGTKTSTFTAKWHQWKQFLSDFFFDSPITITKTDVQGTF